MIFHTVTGVRRLGHRPHVWRAPRGNTGVNPGLNPYNLFIGRVIAIPISAARARPFSETAFFPRSRL
jgi:hypothetical protein